MRLFNRVVRTSVFAAGLLSTSCSDEDSGGTSVPNSAALTALTDSQAQTLCHEWEKSYKDGLPSERAFCTAFAGDEDLSSEICKADLQRCLDEGDYDAEKVDDWECDLTSAEDLAGEQPCTATVGEWRACVEAQLKRFRSVVQRASCDDPSTFEGAWEDPKECEALLAKCSDADT